MGKHKTRRDKTCLNCRHVVDREFCGNCGQQNTETRQTFHHLFIHFFEDLTHYENSFWKTIRNLLFKPALLSKEYLAGKRMSYLAPVRLYIFVSFITFFLIAIIPTGSGKIDLNIGDKQETIETEVQQNLGEQRATDTMVANPQNEVMLDSITKKDVLVKTKTTKSAFGFTTVAEFDSIQKYGTEDEKVPEFLHDYVRKSVENVHKYSDKEILKKVTESLLQAFPKVLIIYMPIFAFFLWLFHNKKKYYYFDHGIFTLHYFSFLLLITLMLFLSNIVLGLLGDSTLVDFINVSLNIVGAGWMILYFFKAHRRFYDHSALYSFIKSVILFIINTFLIMLLFMMLIVYSFINIH